VAILLALATAVVYGTADFLGGLAARRLRALLVVGWSQLAGWVLVAVLALLAGGSATAVDLAWGAAAGAVGTAGLTVFYRALAQGSMSVVAPVTAVCAAAVPVVAGLAGGDAVGATALAGVALALPAVGLVATEPATERGTGLGRGAPRAGGSIASALLAGTAFGAMFVLLHRTSPGSGLWPLVASRGASALLVAVLLLARPRLRRPTLLVPRAALPMVLGAGVADMTANVLYLLAVRQGQLAIVGLLSSLYPVSTVVLAAVVLRERLSRVQLTGVGCCAVAVALIAWG
jgi:drug/metabolite transporter (DMT)-like permease